MLNANQVSSDKTGHNIFLIYCVWLHVWFATSRTFIYCEAGLFWRVTTSDYRQSPRWKCNKSPWNLPLRMLLIIFSLKLLCYEPSFCVILRNLHWMILNCFFEMFVLACKQYLRLNRSFLILICIKYFCCVTWCNGSPESSKLISFILF